MGDRAAGPVQIGESRLYCGDTLSLLPIFEANSVSAVVTDPPFGVRDEEWDDKDSRELARFCMAWLCQARRIAPELVVFCNQDHVLVPLCEMLYKRVRRLIWHKPPGSQYAGGRECGIWYAYETILHCHDRESWSVVEPKDAEVGRLIREARERAGLSKGAVDIAVRGKKTGLCYRWEEGACLPTPDQVSRLIPLLGLDGEFHAAICRANESKGSTLALARNKASEHAARSIDVFSHRTVTGGDHPTEKPLGLMVEILKALGGDWRSVLDPFFGSGTTLLACQRLGIQSIGIEIDPGYRDLAVRRLSAAATPLFDRPALAQASMFGEA